MKLLDLMIRTGEGRYATGDTFGMTPKDVGLGKSLMGDEPYELGNKENRFLVDNGAVT